MTFAEHINVQLAERGLMPLDSGQTACLQDPSRVREAVNILDDLYARFGFRFPGFHGTEFGPFESEDAARIEATLQAPCFDAVCIDAMATDEGRSYGNNEFYVIGFDGPEAALRAASRPEVVAFWVGGREHNS